MKHIKLFEQFIDPFDPFGEEILYEEKTFLNWLKKNYPDETKWRNIKEIVCYGNRLTSLEGIENLVNLESLYCHNNQLTSLEGIENLVNLKYLYCSRNQLISLEGIENLVNLRELSCYNNQFSNEYKEYLKKYCNEKRINFTI